MTFRFLCNISRDELRWLDLDELSARFSSLRQAPLGDRRAPHKPLLILLMLGRYQRGDFRSLLFEEAQVQLKELLFEFGPPRDRKLLKLS